MLLFFKHKSAYAMRISDWSSGVCSSDLNCECLRSSARHSRSDAAGCKAASSHARRKARNGHDPPIRARQEDQKSVAAGKSVSVRVVLGCCRTIKKENERQKILEL